jgi:hypothetical protein
MIFQKKSIVKMKIAIDFFAGITYLIIRSVGKGLNQLGQLEPSVRKPHRRFLFGTASGFI